MRPDLTLPDRENSVSTVKFTVNRISLRVQIINIERRKIDCLSFVMCPLLAKLIIAFFSSFFVGAIYSTNEANKAGGTGR